MFNKSLLVCVLLVGAAITVVVPSMAKEILDVTWRLEVYVDTKGGKNACESGFQLGNFTIGADSDYNVYRGIIFDDGVHFETTNKSDTSWPDTKWGSGFSNWAKVNQVSPWEKDKRASKAGQSIVNHPNTSVCSMIQEYDYSTREWKKLTVRDRLDINKLHGKVPSYDMGLLFHIQGKEIIISPLEICCSPEDGSIEGWGQWEKDGCSTETTALGPYSTNYDCWDLAPTQKNESNSPLEEKEETQGCCLKGKCTERTVEVCGNQFGVVLEPDQQCSEGLCHSLMGACLEMNECHPWRTKRYCDWIDGKFLGNGVPCPLPPEDVGACRISESECRNSLTWDKCKQVQGEWFGKESKCPDEGACIVPEAGCIGQLTKFHCVGTLKGKWLEQGSDCPPKGGCCDVKGQCTEVISEQCTGLFFYPDGCPAECPQPEPEKGICIVRETECREEMTQLECTRYNGKWSTEITKCPERGACYLPCPFGDEVACMESSEGACKSFNGILLAGGLCPTDIVQNDGTTVTIDDSPRLCAASPCDKAIGFWRQPGGNLLYLDWFKRAVFFPDPGDSPAVKDIESSFRQGIVGGFECREDERGRPEIKILWDNNTQQFLGPPIGYETDLSKYLCTLPGTGGDTACFETYKPERGLVQMIRTALNSSKKPLLEVPFTQFVVVKAEGSGYDISISGKDVQGRKMMGSEVFILPLKPGQSKESLTKELAQSYLMLDFFEKDPLGLPLEGPPPCIPKTFADTVKGVPDIFTYLEVSVLQNGPYTTFAQVEAARNGGEFQTGSFWEVESAKLRTWPNWVCHE